MRFVFVAFFTLMVAFITRGADLTWNDGVVVLQDQQVLVGQVAIQPAMDVVLFRSDEKTTFLPAHEIKYAMINDGTATVPRKFVSHVIQTPASKVQLFEVIVEGAISVVRKPKGGRLPRIEEVREYEYFVLNELMELVKLSSFRKEIYPLLKEVADEKELRKTLGKEQLDPTRVGDAIRLIGYYNEYALASALD